MDVNKIIIASNKQPPLYVTLLHLAFELVEKGRKSSALSFPFILFNWLY
jgi:hypothetical protein